MKFEQLKTRSKETPGNYYGRIDTLASELPNIFQVNVTDDMVRQALLKHLPDVVKKSILSAQDDGTILHMTSL